MTMDDVVKTAIGGILALLVAMVTGLIGIVFKNWNKVNEGTLKIKNLEEKVHDLEKEQLTKADVREVVDAALEKRDARNELRRAEWEKRFSLQIKQAVVEGIRDCPHAKDADV